MNANLEHDIANLWSLVFEFITYAEKRLAAHTALHNLTPPQFFVLKTLYEHKGRCPIGQIAREHHLTNATLTGLVNRLEVMQPPLVTRERSSSDRRSVMVVLTAAGEERFWAVQHSLMEQARAVLSLLDPDERRDLIEKITRYIHIIVETFPADAVQPE